MVISQNYNFAFFIKDLCTEYCYEDTLPTIRILPREEYIELLEKGIAFYWHYVDWEDLEMNGYFDKEEK